MENSRGTTEPNISNQQNWMTKQRLTKILIALTGVLVILIGVLGWLLVDRKHESARLAELTTNQFQLIREFEGLSAEYSEIRTDNDTLNARLQARQQEVEDLIEELNTTRIRSNETINQYRRELGTLRDVLKSYIVQVDSLNQANIRLREENLQAQQRVARVQTELTQERRVREDLSARVELGSQLTIEGLTASTLNQRGRETNRLGRIEQVQVCFTVRRNAIADSGMRTFYIRIKRPDGLVLASSAGNVMTVDGNTSVFTASREINYENVDIDVCIFYNDDGSMIDGTYQVEVFTSGYRLGYTEFAVR